MNRKKTAIGAAAVLWLGLAACASAGEPPGDQAAPLYPDSAGEQPYVPLATAEPEPLPPLAAYRSGCCLKPCLECPGPCARFCLPPLYYGTPALDDDWTNPLLQCAGGKCGTCWYRGARAVIYSREGVTRTVYPALPHRP